MNQKIKKRKNNNSKKSILKKEKIYEISDDEIQYLNIEEMKISFHEKKLSYENEEDNQNIKNNKFKEGKDTDSSEKQDKFFSNSSKSNSNNNKKSKSQEESQKEILEDDSDIKEDQNKSKEKKIELLRKINKQRIYN